MSLLHDYLRRSAAGAPERTALEESDGRSLGYGELDRLSDRVRDELRRRGVERGDRVGFCLPKSIDSVALVFGILKAGAAYVPLDRHAPVRRNAFILDDCRVRLAFVDRAVEGDLRQALAELGAEPPLVPLDEVGGGGALAAALERAPAAGERPAGDPGGATSPGDLAYILYTSGSTGKPKGVMLSHENAVSFVEWARRSFEPVAADRFSSHAPLHFDLSILDLYVAIGCGATLVLIGESQGKEPIGLARLIADRRLTVWYSAPSILSLLAEHGRLDEHDLSALRLVLFAGEVFPVKHLRRLIELVPHPRYYNLYGPTETNVCTWHPIPERVPAERTDPYPIGRVCSHLAGRVVDGDGRLLEPGQEGELCISGPSVMLGYWNLPERSAQAFLELDGERWYRTGDVVVERQTGVYDFLGRRDRMVKRRGFRIELGEIEAALYRHPDLSEAAVVALSDDSGVRIRAFVATSDGSRPSLIRLKRFCAENLPLYMVPDEFSHQPTLPKTSTDKIDYQRLEEMD